jgi:polysaccharide deacetylase 2 family uncharacterized protein YibQ
VSKPRLKPIAQGSGPTDRGTSFARLMWRGLAGLWAVVVITGAGGIGVLQYLGPAAAGRHPAQSTHPAHPEPTVSTPAVPAATSTVAATPHVTPIPTPAQPATPAPVRPTIGTSEPALLERSTLFPNGSLPRIAPDGRTARQAYAASFDKSDLRPRVAVLLAGIGMNEADSLAATSLPAPISLAVTPYAARLDRFLVAARATGHELMLSLPMEPQGYPLNDPGNRAMLTGATPATNAQLLEWALTRFSGYVGATGALGELRGERFAAASDQMTPIQETLAQRGLLYVDPRPNAIRRPAQYATYRSIDLVLDEPAGAAELDRNLARLEKLARDRGAAIGLAGRPSPLSVDRIAVWAVGLEARGVALAPVSVVVQMPQAATPPITLSSRTVPLR